MAQREASGGRGGKGRQVGEGEASGGQGGKWALGKHAGCERCEKALLPGAPMRQDRWFIPKQRLRSPDVLSGALREG